MKIKALKTAVVGLFLFSSLTLPEIGLAAPSGVPRCSQLISSSTLKPGGTCYTAIDVNLSIRESFDRRSFDKTFTPNQDFPGFALIDHHLEVHAKTGNGDITVGQVAANARVISQSEVSNQERALFDFFSEAEGKARAQGISVEGLQRLKVRAESEFAQYKSAASRFESSTGGLNISAYAEAICDVRNRLLGGCAIWGPGGNMKATVYPILAYVGRREDVVALKEKYIRETQVFLTNTPTPTRPNSSTSLQACSPSYNPNGYRPGQAGWKGRVAKVAFNNGTSNQVNVTLYHPDNKAPFKNWTVRPGENVFLDTNNYGMDWGIQVDSSEVCIVGRVSAWNSFNGENIFQSGYPFRIHN